MTIRRLMARGLIPVSTFALLGSALAVGAVDRPAVDIESTPAVVRDQAVPAMSAADRVAAPPVEHDESDHDESDHAEGDDVDTDGRRAGAAASDSADTVVAELPRTSLEPFSMFGVTWTGGLVPAKTRVQARWRADGTWTDWTELDIEPTEEGTPGTEPQWVDEADAATVRVISTADAQPRGIALSTIDPGQTPTVTPAAASVGQPAVISRASWGASNAGSCDSPIYGSSTKGVVIHHTAGSNSYSASQSASIVKSTQAYHTKSRKWCDIGYNFLVDRYGQIFEGRRGGVTKAVRAAHSGNGSVNEQTAGISMMGTFESTEPSAALKTAVVNLAAWKLDLNGLPAKGTYSLGGKTLNRIAGHRNVVSTACPGAEAYAWLTSTSSTGLRQRVAAKIADGGGGAALASPTGLTSTKQGATSLDVDFGDVAGAERYHVKASTSPSMSRPTYGRFTESRGIITGLKAATKYYLAVAVVDPAKNVLLSAYSTPSVSAETGVFAAPTGLTGSAASTSIAFRWDAIDDVEKYHVKVSTSSSMSSPTFGKFTVSKGTVTGLKAGTRYYAAVVAVDPARNARISDYSDAQAFTTSRSASPVSTGKNTVTVPSSKTIAFKGHGYGHGIGMSQYGAEGAARDGVGYSAILARYYPGTALSTRTGNIRVLISGDTTDGVLVKGRSGLMLKDLSGDRSISLPTTVGGKAVDRWQIVRTTASASRSKLQYRTTGSYRDYVYKGSALTWSGDGQFSGPSSIGLILPSGTTTMVRGAVRSAKPSGGSGSRDTVNVLSIEDYVRGVIAAEMPSTWHAEALKSQAVAARTYGVRSMGTSRYYDICSTTSCQVYGGASRETASTDSAVKATAGKILTYQGAPALAQFSSSSGGYTNAGSQPYLKPVNDTWDDWSGNKNHSWTISVKASTIERVYSSIGTLRSISVTNRNGHGDLGGRVSSVKLVGSKASKTISGVDARWAFGLRSDWFGF